MLPQHAQIHELPPSSTQTRYSGAYLQSQCSKERHRQIRNLGPSLATQGVCDYPEVQIKIKFNNKFFCKIYVIDNIQQENKQEKEQCQSELSIFKNLNIL